MIMQKCKKCKEVKELISNYWHRSHLTRTGFHSICKTCRNKYKSIYRQLNKEKIKKQAAIYRSKPDVHKRLLEYNKKYYLKNRKIILQKQAKLRKTNKRKSYINKYMKKRILEKYHNDIEFKLHHVFSVALRQSLKKNGIIKNQSILDYLPYTIKELRKHLENQFQPGMSWDNYGRNGWHIDHIYPKSKLLYNSYKDKNFIKCWSLNNLQPLWESDNCRKGNQIDNGGSYPK